MSQQEKVCSKCLLPFPLSEFYNDKSYKDGKSSRCKTCCKIYRQAYRQRVKFKAHIREYRQRPDRKKYAQEYNREYYLRVTKLKRKQRRMALLVWAEEYSQRLHGEEMMAQITHEYEAMQRAAGEID